MTNVMKKFGALLLALALMVTMMPFLAIEANAEDGATAFDVSVNQHIIGSVSEDWVAENSGNPEIMPYLARKGNDTGYFVAAGVTFGQVFSEFYGVDMESLPPEAVIRWQALVKGSTTDTEWYSPTLTVQEYIDANQLFKVMIDGEEGQDPTDYTAPLTENNNSGKAIKAVSIGTVAPMIAAYRQKILEDATASQGADYKPAYQRANELIESLNSEAAIAEWKEGHKVSENAPVIPHLGGTADPEEAVVHDGTAVIDGSKNFVGKQAVSGVRTLDLQVAIKPAEESKTFTTKDAATVSADLGVGDALSAALLEKAEWTTTDNKVAVADKGKITPVGPGTCTVKAVLGGETAVATGGDPVEDEVLATFAVTVDKKAFEEAVAPVAPAPVVKAPAAPKSFKAKNVKKKSVKLTWKKVSGANGYVIYRSTKKNKGFKKIKTITKAKTVKYTNKKLKKGKTYYFKIRAYKTVNGKKVYSKYTSVKKVKIKK